MFCDGVLLRVEMLDIIGKRHLDVKSFAAALDGKVEMVGQGIGQVCIQGAIQFFPGCIGDIVRRQKHGFLAVDLPDTEIVSIAMHIITAENEVGDMHSTILTAKVISELSAIVEHGMEIQLNKESFSYSRFCMHLRYLVQRMMHGSPLDAGNAMDSIFVTMRNEYPQVYACVQQIDTFLHGTYGWQCSKEEQLYLIMHIHRVCVERAED